MSRRWRRRGLLSIAMAGVIGLLGGCGGLLPKPPERRLYRADPGFAFAAPLPHRAAQLRIGAPSAAGALDTRRIALLRTPLSFDYFADAEWTDRVPALIEGALVAGFERSRAVTGVAPDSLGLDADFLLETRVRDFQAEYDSPNGPPRIVVTLEEKLIRLPQRRIVAQASLRAAARAAANRVPAIVAAFDRALGQAVERVVQWTVGDPALSEKSGALRSRTRFVHPGGGDPS